MTDEQWLEYLLRHATNEILHVAAFQGGTIQSQGKWVLIDPVNKLRKLAEAAATAPLLERIAALEAKLAQRVPEWNGFVEGERDQIVTDICEYGTGFVTPLYAIVEGIERKLMERNAAPAAPEQPSEAEMVCAEAYQVVGSLLDDLGIFETDRAFKILDNLSQARMAHHDVLPWEPVAQAPNAQQAEAQEPCAPSQLEAGAKKLAELFDYPWEHMPQQGRQTMRDNIIAILLAINAAKNGAVLK